MRQEPSGQFLLLAAVVTMSLLLVGCGSRSPSPPRPQAPAAPAAAAHDRWPEFAGAFIESYFRVNPFFAVQAGTTRV